MPTKRLLMLITVSVMALAVTVAAACGSDSEPTAQPTSTTIEPIEPGVAAQSTSPGETEQPASLGMPASGSEGVNEKIVVLDGAFEDGSDDDSDGAPVADGERGERVRPGDDVPGILPVKEVEAQEVADTGGLTASGLLNPDSCEGVLGPAPESFELETRSATDSAMADNPAITAMCLAYYSSATNESSLTVVVVTMNSNEAASAHYGIVKNEIATSGVSFDEKRNGDSDLLTVTVDQDGIGAIVILRVGSSFVQVHNGNSTQPRWQTDYLIEFAHSVIERL